MARLCVCKFVIFVAKFPRFPLFAFRKSSSGDFFGLNDHFPDITNDDKLSNVQKMANVKRMVDEHRFAKLPSTAEKCYQTTFGTVRYDADNVPYKAHHKLEVSYEVPRENARSQEDVGIALSQIKLQPTVINREKKDLNFVESSHFANSEQNSETSKNQTSTALDYVKNVRTANKDELNKSRDIVSGNKVEKCDSKGFRILSSQVDDLDGEPSFVIAKLLRKSVIYNENDIVGVYKPYGVSCQPGSGCTHSITSYLSDLGKFVKGADEKEVDLHTVHRLDKETTGVLILAKNQIMAKQLHCLLAQKKIVKIYWAIVAGIPEHLEGTIDIRIAEGSVDGRKRMVLKPERTEETRLVVRKSWVKSHKAVTHYKVLATSGNACLVELRPETGVKHQLRVHLAFGLSCPILGDHKYSHLTKLAPQRLPSDMLQKLNIRQSKVRHVAMHLHAKTVLIPEILPNRYISMSASLPRHFVKNLKRLKIEVP